MKAMLFAAGLGTRLYPHTADRPKALVEINGKTLLELAVNRLREHGAEQIVVNIHHFAAKMLSFLKEQNYFDGVVTVSDETGQVLETGGGLQKASKFFQGGAPFLVYNVDVVTDLSLSDLYETHLKSGALATLAVRDRSTSRYLLFDETYQLCGWEHAKHEQFRMARIGEGNLSRRAFSGVHVISPELLGMMKHKGVFSIIETYLDLAANHQIKAFLHNDSVWMDIGKPDALAKAREMAKKGLAGKLF
ncbi:MAG: nucleotidyltransferase family protein [Bacteroidota bacterium]